MSSRPPSFQAQVEPEHYATRQYDDKKRFLSYWKQADLVLAEPPGKVLEVGIGNGFVHQYLQRRGVSVHTVDADPRLGPDTVAMVQSLPFEDDAFDVVCCFETLEHLPWAELDPSLREMRRVSRRTLLLSLPDVTPYARTIVEWGFGRSLVRRFFDLPNPRPEPIVWQGEHYWEIGRRGYPLARIERALRAAGLGIERVDRMDDNPYHRFFVCSKRPR